MEPTNVNETCSPISSNCIVWQGADIPCIGLCKGATVTDVVAALATELCTIMDAFDVSNYDLECLNLGCAPKDFQELIQLLITRICALEETTPSEGSTVSSETTMIPIGCLEILYELEGKDSQGDEITEKPIAEYAEILGKRICELLTNVSTNTTAITILDERITTLENVEESESALSVLTPVCVLDEEPTALDVVVIALETQFCELRDRTGTPEDINSAFTSVCVGIKDSDQLTGTGKMSEIDKWIGSPANMAQSFNNLWLTICDIRSAISSIQTNCCETGCSTIDLDVTAVILSLTELRIDFTGSIPAGFTDAVGGSNLILTDATGTAVALTIALKGDYYDSGTSYVINLAAEGLDGSTDVSIKTTYNLTDNIAGISCGNVVQSIALGTDTCPDLIITPTNFATSYSFNWLGATDGSVNVIIRLLDAVTDAILQAESYAITSSNPSGAFATLTDDTQYKMQAVINGIACTAETFTTPDYPCGSPTMLTPTTEYSTPTGGILGNEIVAWQAQYDAGVHPYVPLV